MNARILGRLGGLLIVLTSFVAANAGHDLGGAVADAPARVLQAAPDASATAAAAQAHVGDLVAAVERSDRLTGAAIRLEMDGGPVWVRPVARNGGGYLGALTEKSVALPTMRVGDVIRFDETDVRDWLFYGATGRMYGNYTARAYLADMAPRDAAQVASVLTGSPLPKTWSASRF